MKHEKMTHRKLVELLINFRSNERKVKVLQFELANRPQLSGTELIEAMSLSVPEGLGGLTGHISDKTMRIALQYDDRAHDMNIEAKEAILQELVPLQAQQNKLKYYISLLGHDGSVLVGYYLEGKSWNQMEQETEVTVRTLHRWKNEQIQKLLDMYLFSKQYNG
jgi:hypothetical protein